MASRTTVRSGKLSASRAQVPRVGAAEARRWPGRRRRRRSGRQPSGASSRTMSAWTAFTSWYSSTSTASNMPAQHRPGGRIGQRGPPQQQQVVEVDQAVAALVRDIRRGTARRAGRCTRCTRGKSRRTTSATGLLGVHAPGVDVGAHRGPRRPALRADQAVLGPAGVQQVRHVRRVDHGELGWQRERLRVLADDPVGDRVEGPAGDPPAGRPAHAGGAGQHVVGGAAGERQQQDPVRPARPARTARPPGPPACASSRCRPRPGSAAARPGGWPPGAARRSARPARSADSNMNTNVTRSSVTAGPPRGARIAGKE